MMRRVRVLFVCTANSARSQLGEALLNARGDRRVEAGSAGTHPGQRVNPLALAVLHERGIETTGSKPKSIDAVMAESWDVAITVCDSARESCPVFPGAATVHWGLPDPAAVEGDDVAKLLAFRATADVLARRIDRLLALPLEDLSPRDLVAHLDRIVRAVPATESAPTVD
jgi:arsenate reductase